MIRKILYIIAVTLLALSVLSGCEMIDGLIGTNAPIQDNVGDTDNVGNEPNDELPDEEPEEVVTEPQDEYPKVDYDKNLKTVKITLITDDNCTVIGKATASVAKGSDARFAVVFKDAYSFLSLDTKNASYSSGYVTVKGCDKDMTVKLSSAKTLELCSFAIAKPDASVGTVTLSVAEGDILKNTLITVNAIPAESQTFIGWSKDGTLVNGGSVVSYAKNFSFEISEDTKLYPNFLTEGYTVIRYDLNGGTTSDGESTVILSQFITANHLSPNLLADNGQIIRDGYTLLEFTENRDGTGTAINPGGMAKLPKNQAIVTYYAQWSEWTPAEHFTYAKDPSTLEITIQAYNGDSPTVSIPMEIDGFKVTAVASGAFVGKSFETLIIPRTVVKVSAGAFQNCNNFDTLYITDSFTSIPDNAFQKCRAFSHLMLNASVAPHFVNHAESISRRLEVILNRDEEANKSIMMFVGGSSCLYGIKSELIESAYDYKYQILNCGTNAGGTGVLYMEGLSHFMKEGDIIVNVPEYGANQMGGTEIVWRTFRATVACYNIYRYVDFSKYTNFFDAMTEYNTLAEARAAGKPQTYDTPNTSLTKWYCDLAGYRAPNTTASFSAVKLSASSLSNDKINTINNLYTKLAGKNIKYYFSCAPICHYNASSASSPDSDFAAYYAKATSSLKCPVVSNPINYRYDAKEYHNSSYHLCTESAEKHTRRIIEDIQKVIS